MKKVLFTCLAALSLSACSATSSESLYRLAHSGVRSQPVAQAAFLQPEQVVGIAVCAGLTGSDQARARDVHNQIVRDLCIRA